MIKTVIVTSLLLAGCVSAPPHVTTLPSKWSALDQYPHVQDWNDWAFEAGETYEHVGKYFYALDHYRMAYRQNPQHPEAAFNIGVMFHEGRGVARDVPEAIKWFRIAATNGNPHAQTNLRFLGTPF